MEALLSLSDLFSPARIYGQLSIVATYFLTWVVPVIFGLSVATSLLEETLKNVGGEANIGESLGRSIRAAVLISSYAAFGLYIIDFYITVSQVIYLEGSFSTVAAEYARLINEIETSAEKNGLWNKITSTANPQYWLSYAFFLFTFVLVVFIDIALKIGYALLFVFLYVWGLVAISTMPSKLVDLTGGWMKTVIGLLIWPIIEATIFFIITPMILGWSESVLISKDPAWNLVTQQGVYYVFGIINLLLIVLMIIAPIVAYFFSMNQSALMGVVAPMIAAAAKASETYTNIVKGGITSNLSQSINKGAGDLITNAGKAVSQGASSLVKNNASRISDAVQSNIPESVKNVAGNINNSSSNAIESLSKGIQNATRGATDTIGLTTPEPVQPSKGGLGLESYSNNSSNNQGTSNKTPDLSFGSSLQPTNNNKLSSSGYGLGSYSKK